MKFSLLGLLLLVLVISIFGLTLVSCDEPDCYRDDLIVYTADSVNICKEGYWDERDSLYYNYSNRELKELSKFRDCIMLQCYDGDCECASYETCRREKDENGQSKEVCKVDPNSPKLGEIPQVRAAMEN